MNQLEQSGSRKHRSHTAIALLAVIACLGAKNCVDSDKRNQKVRNLQDIVDEQRRDFRDTLNNYHRTEAIRLLKNQILTAWDMARVNIGFLINENARSAQPCHMGVLTMDTVPDLNRAPINLISTNNPNSLIHNTRANLHGAIVSLHHVIRQATDLANPTFDSCPTNRCPTQTEKKWAEDVANLANEYLRQLLPIYSRACRSGGCASVDLPRNIPSREALPENEWLFQNQ